MLPRLKRQRHHFIEALEVRLLLSSSKPTSSSILPQSTPQAFTDDFDRPDSTVVGNGWTNMLGSNGQDLGIVNGKLSGLSPSGDVGIYRPWPLSQSVTVSCVLTYLSGYASTPYRYDASIAFDSDGTIGDGYGIHLTRGDANYNDSAISIFDGNTVLSTTPCSFQFSSDVSLTVTFASDGSISGNVSDGTDAPFPFALGAHAIESAGGNFAYWVALPDPRAVSFTEPTLDDLTIQSASNAPSFSSTFANSDLLRHIFPTYRFSDPVVLTNQSGSAVNGTVTVDYFFSKTNQVTSNSTQLIHLPKQTLDLVVSGSASYATSPSNRVVVPSKMAAGIYYLIARLTSSQFSGPVDAVSQPFVVEGPFGGTGIKGDTAAGRAKRYTADAMEAKANPSIPAATYSDASVEQFLESNEGYRKWAYLDQESIPTIGFGLALQYRNSKGKLVDSPGAETLLLGLNLPYTFDEIVKQAHSNSVKKHVDVLSDADALTLLATTYATAKADAQTAVLGFGSLNPDAQEAVVDMAFNLGLKGLEEFGNMIKDLNAGDTLGAAFESMNSLRATQIPARAQADFDLFVAGEEAQL